MVNKKSNSDNIVARNRKARHEYTLEDKFEAGLVLEGWEVKSVREGKVNITDGFIHIKNGEVFIHNSIITPLITASSHITTQDNRIRKLLLNKREINHLIGAVERQGYTMVPTLMYWVKGRLKLEFHLAKGKQLHDKRAAQKDKDWQREKQRNFKGK